MAPRKTKSGLVRWWRRQAERMRTHLRAMARFAVDIDLLATSILFVLAFVIWMLWHFLLPDLASDYRTEFMGLIFDVVFILVLFSALQYRGRRAQAIARQQEIVEDYKRWDSEEARFRLAGALRRLNGLGVTAINLTGLTLSDFDFASQKIESISGSTLYDGSWGEPFKQHDVKLTNVTFDWVDCSDVTFSPFNPFEGLEILHARGASFIDCSFRSSKLNRSSFRGATMVWKKPPPESLYEHAGFSDDGSPILIPVHASPFEGADLSGASFRDVNFKNADFRGCINLASADFAGATGLDTCVFDADAQENDSLTAARAKIR